VRGEDQFHVGIVVADVDSTLENLSSLFGYEWCDQIGGPLAVTLPAGDTTTIELRFAYSRTEPRLEIIRAVPGTLWEPESGSGIHHLGYWSDDVAADAAELVAHGHVVEATGSRPDGRPYWTFHRSPVGPRIELVSRDVRAGLEQYWAGGTSAG
jgi:hypothetical protein